MADKAMDVYLNDHRAGAMLGSELAGQIRSQTQSPPLEEPMAVLAPQIEQDRQTLIGLMGSLDTSKNPVKQAGAWVTEKASRVKFAGLSSGEPELIDRGKSQYEALEPERLAAGVRALGSARVTA